jgi:integrase
MYLKQRHNRWWAFHDIPKDLRATIGVGVRFHVNLDTNDRKTAENRAASFEREWRRKIDAARQTARGHSGSEADWWNARLRAAGEGERDHVLERIKEEASEIADTNVGDYNPDEWASFEEWALAKGKDPEANRFYSVATGIMARFADHIDDWVKTLRNERKSIDMKRSNVAKFAVSFPYVQDVTRREVQKWIGIQVTEGQKRPATIQRMLSELRGYWKYLISIEVAPDEPDPFDKLTMPKASSKESIQDKRQDFTEREVIRLLKTAEKGGDKTLADLIRLGMWTGARLEEICALKVTDVTTARMSITDAKTSAGIREVPIHSKLVATVRRLKKESADGYLLSGLPSNKYGDRGAAIGKRFGRLKSSLGFGRQHVFHSIRRTVCTLLENAGVSINVSADIVGHEKPSITFGLYSGGNKLRILKKAIEKIDYPGYKPE